MKHVILQVTVNSDVSETHLDSIIGNINDHIENENKFWMETGAIQEGESVGSQVMIETLSKEAHDLRDRISKLADMSHEIGLIADKHNDYDCDTYNDRWEQVAAMESEYQALFSETVNQFGGVVMIPEGHAYCEICETHTQHRWVNISGIDLPMGRCIPCNE